LKWAKFPFKKISRWGLHQSATINLKGNPYRLKEKVKASLIRESKGKAAMNERR
jgi:hypothetical protein